MILPRRALLTATRLPALRARSIGPSTLVHYSTEAAAPASSSNESTTDASPKADVKPDVKDDVKTSEVSKVKDTRSNSWKTYSVKDTTKSPLKAFPTRSQDYIIRTTKSSNTKNPDVSTFEPTKESAPEPAKKPANEPVKKPATEPLEFNHEPRVQSKRGDLAAVNPAVLELNKDIDWSQSYFGAGLKAVTPQQQEILTRPLDVNDVEVKPDGIIYMPEVKYRRKLNDAFGPMGWSVIPRGKAIVGTSIVTREYALIVAGRFVAEAQGVNNYFNPEGISSAIEGCKSNAIMRCCKDLGIASELWDPVYVRWFRKAHMQEVWVEHVTTGKKRILWFKKNQVEVAYPYKLART